MKVLTIDAAWAWAILWGPKRVENRVWHTNYRGPLAIHFGMTRSRDAEAIAFLQELGLEVPVGAELDALRGKIHGVVELVEIRRQGSWLFDEPLAKDPFAFGPCCWILENPRLFEEPVTARGQLGIWELADLDEPAR